MTATLQWAIVVGGVVEVLRGADVVVLVDHVRLHAFDRRGGDQLQVGILRLDRLVELRVAAVVAAGAVEPIFVADLDIGELEGRGMAVLERGRRPTWCPRRR